MQQNERLIANRLDCVYPKIKSNKPNQSSNWNCLPTQFQSRLERDTKKYSMPNWKWSINKNINIKIKLDWTAVIPTQNTKSKWIGLMSSKNNIKQTKNQCQNCSTMQFQSHLERDTKQFPCQVGHCESRKNWTSTFHDLK